MTTKQAAKTTKQTKRTTKPMVVTVKLARVAAVVSYSITAWEVDKYKPNPFTAVATVKYSANDEASLQEMEWIDGEPNVYLRNAAEVELSKLIDLDSPRVGKAMSLE